MQRETTVLAGLRRISVPSAVAAPAPTVIRLGNRLAGALRRLRLAVTDVRSSGFRHAARLALTLLATEVVSAAVPWQRGYWVTLTAVVVLKPDYAATLQRGLARVVGTAAGAITAGLLVDGLHPAFGVETALIAVVAWLAYAVFAASYAAYSVLVSALVVLLLSPTGTGSVSTAVERGLSTLVGGAMAITATLLWPAWERTTLPAALRDLLLALRDYAGLVLSGYVDPLSLDAGALGAAADLARRRRVAAQASRDRAAAEPARVQADVSTATGVLAATGRIVVALHALRATLQDTATPIALPEAAAMRDAVTAALGALADVGPRGAVEGLRERQHRLADLAGNPAEAGPPGGLRARRLAVLATQLDPLVDSIDTVAHLLEGSRAEPATAPASALSAASAPPARPSAGDRPRGRRERRRRSSR
jgi:uncharacterized membrane protein YccC